MTLQLLPLSEALIDHAVDLLLERSREHSRAEPAVAPAGRKAADQAIRELMAARGSRGVVAVADGVVVGSALVQQIADHAGQPELIPEKVLAILRSMREAMDQG